MSSQEPAGEQTIPDAIPVDWDADAYATRSSLQTSEGLALMERVAALPGARLLDLGCGDGRITEALARERGFSVVGLDASPEMVRAAASRGLEVIEASANAIPAPDASFDVVFSNAALHWVDDHPAVVRHIARVLRPGGRLIARMGGAGNQTEITVAGLSLFGAEPYAQYRPADLRSPWNMGDPGVWAAELVRNGMRIHDLRLIAAPSGWRSVDDMKSWFVPVANVFTRFLPEELQTRFFHEAVELAWSGTDPERAFYRLVVDAER